MSTRDRSGVRWIKTEVDEPTDELLLSFHARAVRDEFRRKCDAAGIIAAKNTKELAFVLRYPPLEVVEAAERELIAAGVWETLPGNTGYIDTNHFDVQEKRAKPDALLQREYRANLRADALLKGLGRRETQPAVRNPDTGVENPDEVSMREEERGREEKRKGKRSSAASPRTPRARAGDGSRSKKPSQIEIPPEWAPTAAHRERALALGVDVDRSAERFRNHHAGTLFPGWAAINGRFTNWIDGDKARGPVNGKPSNVGPVRAAAGTDEDAFSGELPI